MKQSPVRMRSPTTSMPGRSAPSRISGPVCRVASSACVRAFTVSALPVDEGLLELVFHGRPFVLWRCQAVTRRRPPGRSLRRWRGCGPRRRPAPAPACTPGSPRAPSRRSADTGRSSPRDSQSSRTRRSRYSGWLCSRMWRMVASRLRKSPNGPTAAMSSTARVSSSTGMPADAVLDHPRELVVHDELPAVEGDARFDHPRPVDQVGPCQRCQDAGEGLLVTGLRVTELRVRLQPGHEARDQVASRHLGDGGADHGDLGRADARRGELEVHGRRRAAVDDRASRARRAARA